jgi:hypothetical protein
VRHDWPIEYGCRIALFDDDLTLCYIQTSRGESGLREDIHAIRQPGCIKKSIHRSREAT